jgi:hypothetical protein
MDLIWAKREGIYFCANGWTGSISLIRFDKCADWRRSALHQSACLFSLCRHSGMVRKHQTRNLEIPDSMLRISLAMSALESRADMPFRVSRFRF